MHLSDSQIEEYDRSGYLLFPGLLDQEEAQLLKATASVLCARPGPEIVREKESNGIRLAYGGHEVCEPYKRLSTLPRLLNPVRQLLREAD
jgi:ectoine hydroxylase